MRGSPLCCVRGIRIERAHKETHRRVQVKPARRRTVILCRIKLATVEIRAGLDSERTRASVRLFVVRRFSGPASDGAVVRSPRAASLRSPPPPRAGHRSNARHRQALRCLTRALRSAGAVRSRPDPCRAESGRTTAHGIQRRDDRSRASTSKTACGWRCADNDGRGA